MPDNKIANNSFTSEVTAEFTSQSTEFAKTILKTLFKTATAEAESAIKDPEKRREFLDRVKQIFSKPNVQNNFEELYDEVYKKGCWNLEDFLESPEKAKIYSDLQALYFDGIWDGFSITMMGLMENNAPIDMLATLHNYMVKNGGNHPFENRQNVSEQYEEKLKQYKEMIRQHKEDESTS